MSPNRTTEIYLIVFLPIIALLNLIDAIEDYQQQVETYHLVLEALQVVIVTIAILLLFKQIYKRQYGLDKLQKRLEVTRESLADSQVKIKKLSKEYMEIIHAQFDEWGLSPSERDVAIFLLKGLSFEEISSIRKTKEKTVRQQASSIYRKSNLSGRHEFAAWFFEDLLN